MGVWRGVLCRQDGCARLLRVIFSNSEQRGAYKYPLARSVSDFFIESGFRRHPRVNLEDILITLFCHVPTVELLLRK